MGFDQLDIPRIDPVFLVNLLLQPRLRFRVGRRDPIRPAILIHSPSLNHPVNDVAIAFRVRQPLQQHHTHAFTRHKTIRSLIEGVTSAFRREHARVRRHQMQLWPCHHMHTPGQGQITATPTQTVTGLCQRHQR